MLLSKQEDELIWNRIYDELQFKPNSKNRSHIFTNNLPFKIDRPYVVYAIENMTDDQVDKMERLIKRVFIQTTKKGDKIYALDWQHSSFLYDPREDSEQKSYWVSDSHYMGGGYSAYFPSYYPDGDYYFFVAENFDFGYLGHPWRNEVWIWGEAIIMQFQQIYKELGWDKLYSYPLCAFCVVHLFEKKRFWRKRQTKDRLYLTEVRMKIKNEAIIFLMYALLALPVPFSLLSWIGTLISVANIGMIQADNASVMATTIIALSAMLMAGTYPATYGFSLYKTIKNKCLKFVSFLPIIHIALTMILLILWSLFE